MGWKHSAGGRSFTFQLIVIGWTCLIAGLMVAQTFGIATHKSRPGDYSYGDRDFDRTSSAAALGISWFCLGVAWLLIALPCGIAAIATHEGGPHATT